MVSFLVNGLALENEAAGATFSEFERRDSQAPR